MADTDVDTLDEDVQNTNTEDIVNEEPIDETPTNEEELSIDQISDMSDEEFVAYYDKVENTPVKVGNEGVKTNDLPETDTNTRVEKDNAKKEVLDKQGIQSEDKETIDYETEYKRLKQFEDELLKPIKVRGKEIAPRDLNDIKSLVGKGYDYTYKTQELAKIRKMADSLTKHNITESELNFLIAIHNKDRQAIEQLLVDNDIDPMDINIDEDRKANKYSPANNLATDNDVEFGMVVDEIKSSGDVAKITDIINNVWDNKSKIKLYSNHNLLKALHQEVKMGRFDDIQKMVEADKIFGNRTDESDLDAYIRIVNQFVAEQTEKLKANTATKTTTPKPKTNTPQTTSNKDGARPTGGRTSIPAPKERTVTDWANMSDEEFIKNFKL